MRAIGTADALRGLPADTHYLGTLAHVGLASLRLGERAYAEAALALLAHHGAHFASHLSFFSEGAVPHVLGALLHGLGDESGRHARAIPQLEEGIAMNDRAGFALRAVEGRLLLAQCLAERREGDDARRATLLRRQARSSATRIGMRRLLREHGTRDEATLPELAEAT